MKRLLRPSFWRQTLQRLRSIRDQGGPKRVALKQLDRPRGWFFPSATATVDVETRSGTTVQMRPELPIPWPYAWGYRLARRLNLPMAATLEPDDVRVSLPLPGFIGRWLSR